jgi:hypothetical protein
LSLLVRASTVACSPKSAILTSHWSGPPDTAREYTFHQSKLTHTPDWVATAKKMLFFAVHVQRTQFLPSNQ